MPASLIAAGDALARFFAAPEIGSVPHRSARQGILILVAFIGGMLPISNMAMLSSAYLALSGDFNADLIDLGRLALGNLLIMGLVQPLVNHIHAGLGLRGALFLALCVVSVAGVGAASSGSLTEMTLWYALAGFGGGLFLSLSARILFVAVPPESRRLMMAIWSFFIGFGSNLSPLLGGLLVEFLTWHSLFLLSPVVALPCLVILFFLLPDSRPAGMPPFDWCSFAFLVAFAVPTLIAVCYGQTFGWNSSFILIMIFCAVSALFLFLVSCLSAEAPLLHLRNLRIKGVGPAVMAALLLVISHVGMRIQMILFMRNVLGYPPSEIGLMFLLPLCVFVLTVVPTGIMVATHGNPKPFLLAGIACIAAAGPPLSRLDANADWLHIAAPLCDGQRFGHALPVAQRPAGEAAADAPGHQQRAFLQHVLVHGVDHHPERAPQQVVFRPHRRAGDAGLLGGFGFHLALVGAVRRAGALALPVPARRAPHRVLIHQKAGVRVYVRSSLPHPVAGGVRGFRVRPPEPPRGPAPPRRARPCPE